MPRHSKNSTASSAFTYHEKRAAAHGTVRARVGTDSQLPFGHCCLCLQPVAESVVSPSGHMYCRECILEYLLTKTKELKKQKLLYDAEQARIQEEGRLKAENEADANTTRFMSKQDGVQTLLEREDKVSREEEFRRDREKEVDDRDREVKRAELKAVSFWIPDFTPEAKESAIPPPPKRPSSPMSKQPLRAKDLIAVDLIEDGHSSNPASRRYICPVTRDQITTQKVVVLKTNGKYMLETAAVDLAYPTMTCPLTGERFKMSDVIELQEAATSFAASGQVEAKRYKPSMR